MKNYILILIAVALDLLIGDPVSPIHPVRVIGRFILTIETLLYEKNLPKRISGSIAVIFCLVAVLFLFLVLLKLSSFLPYGRGIFTVMVFYSVIAIKDLAAHGLRVKKALDNNNFLLAREKVGMILSRDTLSLSQDKIIIATVESISENSSDSIIAPIFWGLILGPAGALVYRVINTMDAMWGYKNERYINFGRTAAILDDIVNFLPARLTGMLICFGSVFTARFGSGLNAGNPLSTAWRIMIRDYKKTASPNAGYPEAAMAGVLGIQLGGEAYYFGEKVEKPTIGDNTRNPETGDISKALRIIVVSVVLFLLVDALVLLFVN